MKVSTKGILIEFQSMFDYNYTITPLRKNMKLCYAIYIKLAYKGVGSDQLWPVGVLNACSVSLVSFSLHATIL